MKIIDTDKQIALDIFSYIIHNRIKYGDSCRPNIYIYYGNNAEYIEGQFEKIVRHTKYFQDKCECTFWEQGFVFNDSVYFLDDTKLKYMSGVVGNIYCFTIEDYDENKYFFKMLNNICPQNIFYIKEGYKYENT